MSRLRYVQGNITETTSGSYKVYSKKNIEIHSHSDIIQTGKANGVTFGEPKSYSYANPQIIEVQFLDENNKIIKQETITKLGGLKASNILFGKKVKIKILTKEVKDGTKISFKLKGETKSKHQDFFGIDKLIWDKEIKDNACETEFFEMNGLWNSEDFEKYNYTSHKTEIDTGDFNGFYIAGVLNAKPFELPTKEDRLKPISYLRNYEELIGLFNTDDSGTKDLVDNYENRFILSNSEIAEIVRSFSEFINNTTDLAIPKIKTRVAQDAKKLWDTSTKQVQSGKLDDRPLYWARNKMQVRLKRHFLFENDIDFEKSLVKKGTELEKIIQLFEEKSRNYDGIDFSKATAGSKKVLITGFDPFILNQFDNKFLIETGYSPNILQSNPSGVMALSLNNNEKLEAYIQTMIVPVRYTDFDGSQEYDKDKGIGLGIIEKYIKPFISQVDMIITISQSGPGDYNIDKFSTATRGGFNDNFDFKREKGSQALISSDEWIETTLPKEFTNAPNVVYNWEFNRNLNPSFLKPKPNQKLSQGSGGDYLSNEIFYRVAKLRKDNKPTLKTGHFHISKIQEEGEDLNSSEIKEVLKTVKKGIEEGIKGI